MITHYTLPRSGGPAICRARRFNYMVTKGPLPYANQNMLDEDYNHTR